MSDCGTVRGRVGGWMIIRKVFVEPYLRKYNSSEVETLRVGRVWWKVDAHHIFDLECFNAVIKIDKFVRFLNKIDSGHGMSGF